jgi:hypothetical protein
MSLVLFTLFWLSWSVRLVLFWLSYPSFHVLTCQPAIVILFEMSYSGILFCLSRSGCPDLFVLSWLPGSGSPILAALFWLFCPGCPYLLVILAFLTGCPVLALLFMLPSFQHPVSIILSLLSCSACPALAVVVSLRNSEYKTAGIPPTNSAE